MQEPAAVLSTALAWLEAGLEECGYQAAEFAEVSATMAEERPN